MNMNKICPVKNCDGWYTTSGRGGKTNHIIGQAKRELFNNFISGKNDFMPHADYLKEHIKRIKIITYNI